MQPRIHHLATDTLLVATLCKRITTLAENCINQRGYFSIVLAGGATPRELYRHLRHIPTDWQRWHVYFGDERCLPAGHPERNDSMASTAWLDHVAIPAGQVHRVLASVDVCEAALAYAAELEQSPGFDLVLLGLGEDGHTASLFPGDTAAHTSTRLAVAVTNAPKSPAQRVSMSPECLSRAAAVWFLVTGFGKRQALEDWLSGVSLPPQMIKPQAGIDIFTDIKLRSSPGADRETRRD